MVRSRVRNTVAAVAVAGVVAAGAAGCAPMKAGAAATVGSDRITEAQLHTQVLSLQTEQAKIGVAPSANAASQQLDLMLQGVIWDRVASDEGVTVTDAEVAADRANATQQLQGNDKLVQTMADLSQQSQGETDVAPVAIDRWFRNDVIARKVQSEVAAKLANPSDQTALQQAMTTVLMKAVNELKIKTNPRYGTFDPAQGTIVPGTPSWLKADSASSANSGSGGATQ